MRRLRRSCIYRRVEDRRIRGGEDGSTHGSHIVTKCVRTTNLQQHLNKNCYHVCVCVCVCECARAMCNTRI